MTQKVNNYMSGYNKCQQIKSFPEKPTGKLQLNKQTVALWKDITTDFVTELLEAQKI